MGDRRAKRDSLLAANARLKEVRVSLTARPSLDSTP